jgi:hypothetical protein
MGSPKISSEAYHSNGMSDASGSIRLYARLCRANPCGRPDAPEKNELTGRLRAIINAFGAHTHAEIGVVVARFIYGFRAGAQPSGRNMRNLASA